MATVTKFTSLPAKLLNKEVDWDTDTIKLMLVDAGYTFSAAHDYKADIDAISGGWNVALGYSSRPLIEALRGGRADRAASTARTASSADRTTGDEPRSYARAGREGGPRERATAYMRPGSVGRRRGRPGAHQHRPL